MSKDLMIKIDILKDNQKSFQILEQPSKGFRTFIDNETGVNIGSVNMPEFYKGPLGMSDDFELYLRGDKTEEDFKELIFYFDEEDMERLIKALTKFCEEMEWNLKLVGSYFNEIVLGEL